MKLSLLKYIKKLVAANAIEKALIILQNTLEGQDEEADVVLISGSYHELKEDKQKGILSKEQQSQAFARIRHSLLAIAQGTKKEDYIEVRSLEAWHLSLSAFLINYHFWILFVGWALFVVTSICLYQTPKWNIKVRLEVIADRIDFKMETENTFEINEKFRRIYLSTFHDVTIPAESVQLEGQTNPYPITAGKIKFVKTADDGQQVSFDSASLGNLKINASEVTLTVSEDPENPDTGIKLDINPGNVVGRIIFQNSLPFESNYTRIENLLEFPGYESFIKGVIHISDSEVATFTGGKDVFSLTLEPINTGKYAIKKQNLYVSGLKFQRPEGSDTKGTVINANIHFIRSNGEVYHTVNLPNRYSSLILDDNDIIQLTSLALNSKEISITLEGTVRKLLAGSAIHRESLQNPNILYWIWYNQPIWLIGIVSFIFFWSFALYGYVTKRRNI